MFRAGTPAVVNAETTNEVNQSQSQRPFRAFKLRANTNAYEFNIPPPTISELHATLDQHNVPARLYRAPYYSKQRDAPTRSREYGGLVFRLKGGGISSLEEWVGQSSNDSPPGKAKETNASKPTRAPGVGGWEYAGCPPSAKAVNEWLSSNRKLKPERQRRLKSQVRVVAL
jgi:DNA polymerase zeta